MQSDRESTSLGYERPKSLKEGLIATMKDGQAHDLKDFLRRPYIVKSYQWTVGTGDGVEMFSISLPEDILTNNAVMAQKATGFLGFRATAVLKFQVNANRFQQGRLLMTFFPGDDVLLAKHYTASLGSNALMMKTQLPRVEFDVSKDSEVEMRIPYTSPYLGYNLTNGEGHVGHVGVTTYSDLVSVTSGDSAEITVWGHFEDIELDFPTISNPTYILQSGNVTKSKKKDPSSGEQLCKGPISSHIDRIRRVANIMTEVPFLSSIAAPVGWFAGIAANTAASLGFSNPQNTEQSITIQQKIFDKAYNVSGRDNSHNLALMEDNQLELLPEASSNDKDEMALNYVLSKFAYTGRTTWHTSDAQYSILATIPLGPQQWVLNDSTGLGNYTTPVSYFANLFRYYRGSFKMKFKVVKTEFHSGRIAVAYIPGYVGKVQPTVVDATHLTYLHKDIHDLRETSEFEFTAPFAATTPWLATSESYGYVYVFVINPLRAPATVSSAVTVLMEAAADTDFVYSKPIQTTSVPYLIAKPSANYQSGDEAKVMPKDTEDSNTLTMVPKERSQGIGNSEVVVDNTALANRHCMGEIITSLRQIIKRSTPYMYACVNYATQGVYSTYISPWLISIPMYDSTNGGWVLASCSTADTTYGGTATMVDYLTFVSVCYTFSRGGVRLRSKQLNINLNSDYTVSNVVATTLTTPMRSDQEGTPGRTGTFSTTNYGYFKSGAPVVGTVYPVGEFRFPYQNKFHMFYNCISYAFSNIFYASTTHTFSSQLQVGLTPDNVLCTQRYVPNTNTLIEGMYFRQAADDFSCHFFSGTPPVSSSIANNAGGNIGRATY